MRVIYTRLLFWAEGMAITPNLVLVVPARRDDVPLLAHEQKHCAQMRELGTLRFWWRYATDISFRLNVEVEAYRVQLSLQPRGLESFANVLAQKYRLRIDVDTARALLLAPPKGPSP